jgi:methylenetetrahydrofolate--tRNA-(uracil-5-)-methyltransferase
LVLEHNGETPYAVVQLRQDNLIGDLYNMVGFQTNLTYGEQKRVFSLIPGLEHAEFIRYGLMHRNSYLYAPKVLDEQLRLKNNQNVYIGGQLSGVEGYVESAATGLLAAYYCYMNLKNIPHKNLSYNSVLGRFS